MSEYWQAYSCLEEALPTGMCDAQWSSWLGLAERIPYSLWALGIVVYLLVLVAMVMRPEVAR